MNQTFVWSSLCWNARKQNIKYKYSSPFCIFFFKFLDGGIARLRVYGIALKDWAQILSKKVFNVTTCRGNFHTFELLEYLSGKHTNCLQKIIFFLEAVGMIIEYLFLTRFYTAKPIHTPHQQQTAVWSLIECFHPEIIKF